MGLVQVQQGTGTAHGKAAWFKSPRLIRHGVMAFFFVFLLHVAWEHQVKGGGPKGSPSIEAYCPFGGVENLYQFLTTGGFVRHIEPSAMILLGAVLLMTLLFSRGFCGWLCPFGSMQEWLGLLGRKIFGRSYNPTGPWERRMRLLKYPALAVIVGLTWHLGVLVFRPYDPFLAFFHLGKGVDEMPYAYAALGLVLAGSLKYERFFCKYACPLGAVIGIAGKLGLMKVVREDDGCKGCNICQKKCFAHIDFLSTNTIRDAECNHCLDCVTHCPKPSVLSLRGAGWSLSTPVYAGLLVAGLFATVGVSQMSGKWRTKPEMVAFTDRGGKLDAGQIRGWMTLDEVSAGYGVPRAELYRMGGLPGTVDGGTRLNQVARKYGLAFEPDKLREAVEHRIQAPPQEEARAEGKGAVAPLAAAPRKAAGAVPKKAAEAGQHGGEEPEVRGMMTLAEIEMKTGVPKEFIVKRLAVEGEVDARVPLREWMHEKGRSIGDVRDAVAAYRAGSR
jgi:polyferredoxin